MQRGKISYHNRARQQRDYSGLRYDNVTPTDIDGIIDYHNQAWIILELKYLDAELPYGQRLAFERLTDDLAQVKPAIFIIASHDIENTSVDIPAAECSVFSYRKDFAWHIPQNPVTVKELIEQEMIAQ